jgi:hypothetical protein
MPDRVGWVHVATERRAEIGGIAHVAAGRCVSGSGSALDLLGPSAVGACLWAVDRGLPDEVVARVTFGNDGLDRQVDAVLSWTAGPDAEVLVATGVAAREWLVVTGSHGELEVRPAPFSPVPGEVWVSDGTTTERLAFGRAESVRLVDEHDVASVVAAVRASAAGGGAPEIPS